MIRLSKLKSFFFLLNVVLPLLCGGLVYIAFRDTNILMFKWFNAIGIMNYIISFREQLLIVKTTLPKWFLYSLPDALWIYSFCVFLFLIWYESRIVRILAPGMAIAFTILAEVLQLFNILPGTFDWRDLLLFLTFGVFSLLTCNFYFIKKNSSNRKDI